MPDDEIPPVVAEGQPPLSLGDVVPLDAVPPPLPVEERVDILWNVVLNILHAAALTNEQLDRNTESLDRLTQRLALIPTAPLDPSVN